MKITSLINLFLKSRVVTVTLIFGVVAYTGWVYWYADKECKENIIVQERDISEKRNEIANNPATVDDLRKRLRDSTY